MTKQYSDEQIKFCISMLEDMAENSGIIANIPESERIALLSAAGKVSRPDRKYLKQRRKELNRIQRQPIVEQDRKSRALTGIRSARDVDVFKAPHKIDAIAFQQDKNINSQGRLNSPRNCYICKAEFLELHHFYDAMCPECAAFNYQKRFQTASLDGQTALITGARVKIGYQAALMMLRAGAEVIVTTRFPVDAAIRYSKEEDFDKWQDRLHIYGLDLRHTPSVEIFAGYIEHHYHRLDILINNAAQTVRRPPGFYAHLMNNENLTLEQIKENHGRGAAHLLADYNICKNNLNSILINKSSSNPHAESSLLINKNSFNSQDAESSPIINKNSFNSQDAESSPIINKDGSNFNPSNFASAASELSISLHKNVNIPAIGIQESAKLSQIPYSFDDSAGSEDIFPRGELDIDQQQVDLRRVNSWRLMLGDIHTAEMVEVQLVNSIAPFVLCNRLISLMKKDYTGQKHIVNVTAMEGKFYRFKQASRHPHTNMAKAALNMMTHTAAQELSKYGIYINAVDTGWVTDEDPVELAKYKETVHDFQPPLDIVDGAARICDPFFDGILRGKHWCGKFLKDYKPIDW